MLYHIVLLAIALLLLGTPHATAGDLTSRSAEEAASFIKVRTAQSPQHDGVPLRMYEIATSTGLLACIAGDRVCHWAWRWGREGIAAGRLAREARRNGAENAERGLAERQTEQ